MWMPSGVSGTGVTMCWAHGALSLQMALPPWLCCLSDRGRFPLRRHPGGPRSREVTILAGGPHIDADTLLISLAHYSPELLGPHGPPASASRVLGRPACSAWLSSETRPL